MSGRSPVTLGLKLGWIGYTSLRRDQLSPIATVDKYHTAVTAMAEETGNKVAWFQCKHMTEDCYIPPANADWDEHRAFNSVIHYRDGIKSLAAHCNAAPTRGRWEWLQENPYDWSLYPYEIPALDVVFVESSCQIGSAYTISLFVKRLHEQNPNMGIVILDQDLAAVAARSKIGKWFHNLSQRCIYATHHAKIQFANQVMVIVPHPKDRTRAPAEHKEHLDFCYVGNDYKRRDKMMKFLKGPRFHHYGRLKKEFSPILQGNHPNLHGPFSQDGAHTIEDVYRSHGLGINFVRDEYNRDGQLTPRISEVIRSGVPLLCDRDLRIAAPIIGDFNRVESAEEAIWKANTYQQYPDYYYSTVQWQQSMLQHYCSTERYVDALMSAAAKVSQGPVYSYRYNPYDDLLASAGITPWGKI